MECQDDINSLGVPAIDSEHLQLSSLFAEYVACIRDAAPRDVILAVLRAAVSFANDHMQHEECLMAETEYPARNAHMLQHRQMRLQTTTLMSDASAVMLKDPVTLRHLIELQKILSDHINGPDRQMAAHLRQRGVH